MKTTDTNLPYGVHKLSSVLDEIMPTLQPTAPTQTFEYTPDQEAQVERLVDTRHVDYEAAREILGIQPVDPAIAHQVGNVAATGSEIQR